MTIIALYIKSIPQAYSAMFSIVNVAIMNAMACRMYRNTKLGINWTPPSFSTILGAIPSKPVALHLEYSLKRDDSVTDGDGAHLSDGVSSHTTLQKVHEGEGSPSEKAETMV